MVKKASAASGNGGSRKARTSAAAAADKPAGIWGGGALPLDPDTVSDENGGFTTDSASGQRQPNEGDHSRINGEERVFTQGEWVPASEEVAGPAPKTPRKPRGKKAAEQPDPPTNADGETEEDEGTGTLTNMTSDLVAGVERLERLNEEISALKDDAKEIIGELKSKGYSPPIIRKAIRRRAMDPDKRNSDDSMLAQYEEALRGA